MPRYQCGLNTVHSTAERRDRPPILALVRDLRISFDLVPTACHNEDTGIPIRTRMNEQIPPRQQEILAAARVQGRVNVDDLAVRFDVTPQTIRKDLNELCEMRLLSRVHGGAIVLSGVENIAYEARRFIAQNEK